MTILGFFFTNYSTILLLLLIVTIYYVVKIFEILNISSNIQAEDLTALHPRPKGRGFTAVRIKPTSIICQSEIGTHFESFSAGLSNSLRSANDAILVGEILDKESIENAILASMLGTLVYTTGHSTGVASSIKRLVNSFPVEERNTKTLDILTSIKVVVSQMLIPSIDGKRIPIREYLIFTEEIVDYLSSSPLEYLSLNINKLLKEKNTNFIFDLNEKYKNNLIYKEDYLKILKNFK